MGEIATVLAALDVYPTKAEVQTIVKQMEETESNGKIKGVVLDWREHQV